MGQRLNIEIVNGETSTGLPIRVPLLILLSISLIPTTILRQSLV